jgi:hypothetical protein
MHRIARECDRIHLNLGWLTIGVFRHLCNQQLINLIAMRRDEVLAIVKAHQAKLQELGVKSLDSHLAPRNLDINSLLLE